MKPERIGEETQVDRVRDFAFGARQQPNYSWWKPLAEMLTVIVMVIAMTVVVGLSLEAAGLDTSSPDVDGWFTYATVIVEIIAVLVAVKLVGRRSAASVLWSGKALRPLTLVAAYLLAFAVIAVTLGLISVYAFGSSWDKAFAGFSSTFPLELVAILLAALAEEMLFRGLVFQAFTAWTRHPLVGAIAAALLFVAVHPAAWSEPLAFAHFFLDGLLYAWLAWYFNGIGIAVAAHAAWNTAASLQDYGVPLSLGGTATQFVAAALAVVVLTVAFRRARRPLRP